LRESSWFVVGVRGSDGSSAVASVCSSEPACRQPVTVADRLPSAVDLSADHAALTERTVHCRAVVEVHPDPDHRHRNAHVPQVEQASTMVGATVKKSYT